MNKIKLTHGMRELICFLVFFGGILSMLYLIYLGLNFLAFITFIVLGVLENLLVNWHCDLITKEELDGLEES